MKKEHPMTPGVLVPRVPGGAHPLYERAAPICAIQPAVKESLTAEPVAYAVFADNGNIQIWTADPEQVETLRQRYGKRLKGLFDGDYVSSLLAAGGELDNQLRQWLASEDDESSVAAREVWQHVLLTAASQKQQTESVTT